MALAFFDLRNGGPTSQAGPDVWLPGGRTVAIASAAETIVKRELLRYLSEEVEGRSFLIAGHRGSGKTTLVLRAVADLTEAILAEPGTGQPFVAAQRPLLVKLHGPSLLTARLPKVSSTAVGSTNASPDNTAAGAAPAASGKAGGAGATSGDKATSGVADAGSPGATSGEPADDRTHVALVQLTTALYRALAAEVARGFRIHAAGPIRQGDVPRATRQAAERLELAARLRLELDKAPDPETLRGYYLRLRRLYGGVLWPPGVGRDLDQGAREIVAIATAAQAFQVCSGAISYAEVSKNSGERTLTNEAKTSIDLKSFLDRLSGLAAGAAIGAAVQASGKGAAAALMAGAAGAVLTGLTFSLSSSRTDKRDLSSEYRFIRDFSLSTLDRDLPEVIRRVRDAGLAPVFVLDELDKLETMSSDLESLIGRLKNLTTDYGFFCFLTNRSYYEGVSSLLKRSAYPKEFTYFSNLLFVRYSASEILRYLLRVVRQAAASDSAPIDTRTSDATAWMTFAFALRHRARLNSIALMRELASAFDERGQMPSAYPAVGVRSRLQAAVQLAIDLALDGPDISARCDADPLFAQLAVDAVYMLSAAWERGDAAVSLTPSAVKDYLRSRSDASQSGSIGQVPDAGTGGVSPGAAGKNDAPVLPTDGISPEELELLSRTALQVADLLVDFNALQVAAREYWTLQRRSLLTGIEPADFVDAGTRALSEIVGPDLIPSPAGGLVEAENPGRYVFKVDPFGALLLRDRGTGMTIQAATAPAEDGQSPLELANTCEAILGALRTLGVRMATLVEAQALPGTVREDDLNQAADAVRAAMESSSGIAAPNPEYLSTLRSFNEACIGASPALGLTLFLARLAVAPGASLDEGVRAVARHVRLGEALRSGDQGRTIGGMLGGRLSDVPTLPDNLLLGFDGKSVSIQQWASNLAHLPTDELRRSLGQRDPRQAWSAWRPRVMGFLDRRDAPTQREPDAPMPPSMHDIVEAARNAWPGGLFRTPLAQMSVREWSALALRAFPALSSAPKKAANATPEVPPPPPWTLVAALAALRFRRDILEVAHRLTGDSEVDLWHVVSNAPLRAPDDRGVMWVVHDEQATLSREPMTGATAGVLAVGRDDVLESHPLIEWLKDRGGIDAIVSDA